MDLNKTSGEECKTQLDAEFGEDNCIFIQCDITNGDALKGKLTSLTHLVRLARQQSERLCF